MRRRRRIRKAVKWGGVVLLICAVAAWIASYRWTAMASTAWPRRSGAALLVQPSYLWIALWYNDRELEIVFDNHRPTLRRVARWDRPSQALSGHFTPWTCHLKLPFWFLTALPLTLSASAWAADILARRRRAGCCPSCSYDRAGLADAAPCPECGQHQRT